MNKQLKPTTVTAPSILQILSTQKAAMQFDLNLQNIKDGFASVTIHVKNGTVTTYSLKQSQAPEVPNE
jgi:hypothetical protein